MIKELDAPKLRLVENTLLEATWGKCVGKNCTYEVFWGVAGY